MIKGVILVGVGRNLNRAIRTCYTFGVYDVYCINCGEVTGNLFSAQEKVTVHRVRMLDLCRELDIGSVLALERLPSLPELANEQFPGVKYLAVGGESTTLRKREFPRMARIGTTNELCLTSEAALAIGLYTLGGQSRERNELCEKPVEDVEVDR